MLANRSCIVGKYLCQSSSSFLVTSSDVLICRSPSERLCDLIGESHGIERFCQRTGGTNLFQPLTFDRLHFGRKEKYWDVFRICVLAEQAQNLGPILARKHDVEQNRVGPGVLGKFHSLRAGAGAGYPPSCDRLQAHSGDLANIIFVVDEQDVFRGSSHFGSSTSLPKVL